MVFFARSGLRVMALQPIPVYTGHSQEWHFSDAPLGRTITEVRADNTVQAARLYETLNKASLAVQAVDIGHKSKAQRKKAIYQLMRKYQEQLGD